MRPSSCLSQGYKKYRHKGVTNKMILNRECIAKICGLLAVGRATSFQARPPVLANCPDIQGDHTSTTLAFRCKSNDKPSHHLILMGPGQHIASHLVAPAKECYLCMRNRIFCRMPVVSLFLHPGGRATSRHNFMLLSLRLEACLTIDIYRLY